MGSSKVRAEGFDGGPGSQIAHVRLHGDAVDLPGLEGVRE
jgi:hypothetical protein